MIFSKNCIQKNCISPVHIRGLCIRHYTRFKYLVKTKRGTWKYYEETGQALKSNNDPSLYQTEYSKKMLEESRNKKLSPENKKLNEKDTLAQ